MKNLASMRASEHVGNDNLPPGNQQIRGFAPRISFASTVASAKEASG